MGKNIQFREYDQNADVEIWAIRINKGPSENFV